MSYIIAIRLLLAAT